MPTDTTGHPVAHIEVTDTYGGESNYSWVRRYELAYTPCLTQRAIVRRVKALVGWTGYPCAVTNYGDMIELRPRGLAQVCFVTY